MSYAKCRKFNVVGIRTFYGLHDVKYGLSVARASIVKIASLINNITFLFS
jgi:hypothetical protein